MANMKFRMDLFVLVCARIYKYIVNITHFVFAIFNIIVPIFKNDATVFFLA